jgi:hypothetical protein
MAALLWAFRIALVLARALGISTRLDDEAGISGLG